MPGRFKTLPEALAYVVPRVGDPEAAKGQILALLSRRELRATAERAQNFFVWKVDPMFGGGYKAHRNLDKRMIPIEPDWWASCIVDWDAGTAHRPWSLDDFAKVGHKQPYQTLVDGVLLVAADIQKHWQAKINARILRVVRRKAASPKHAPRRRGRKAFKLGPTVEAMRAAGIEAVNAMTEKQMADRFGVSRDTARRARDELRSEFQTTELTTFADI
jgi:hypothetical protein